MEPASLAAASGNDATNDIYLSDILEGGGGGGCWCWCWVVLVLLVLLVLLVVLVVAHIGASAKGLEKFAPKPFKF